MRKDSANDPAEWPPIELSLWVTTMKINRRFVARAFATAVSVMILAGITALVFQFVPGVLETIVALKEDHPRLFYIGVGIGAFNTTCAIVWAAIKLWTEIESEIDGT